jgi:hypothetical protein
MRQWLALRALFEKSGLALDEVGERMGYPWLSMLRRFAKAVGVDVKELL